LNVPEGSYNLGRMKFLVSLLRCLPLLLLGLFLGGCQPQGQSQIDEEKEPHFLAGKNRLNTMDFPAAVESFERALTFNPKSAAAHFELGWLFDQKVPDPAAAIYHYEHYLRLQPNAERAEWVKQHILACKQELARTVSLGPVTEKQQRDLEKLAEDNKRLTEENRRLNDEVAKWRTYAATLPRPQTNPPARITQPNLINPQGASLHPAPGAAAPRVQTSTLLGQDPRQPGGVNRGPAGPGGAPPPKGAPAAPMRTHVIKARETLASVARQYGVKLEALSAANPKATPRHLRPGQTLKVPPP
jgi:tetratricopeptide (TPR) repeat protein